MLHIVQVRDRELVLQGRDFVQNGIASDYIGLELDEEFAGMDSVLLTIENSAVEGSAVIASTGEQIKVPERILAKTGALYFTLTGYKGDEQRIVTRAMDQTEAGYVVRSGELGVTPTSEEDAPDITSHVAKLETQVANLIGIIDSLLGITSAEEGDTTDEDRAHLARTMYDSANVAVHGVRPIPRIISRAGLDDADALEFHALYPEWEATRAYQAGDVFTHEGTLYRAVGDVEPGKVPGTDSSYVRVPSTESTPAYEEWRQPFGAHDAYAAGAVVIDPTDGRAYRSKIDGNVYGPPSQYTNLWEIAS